MCFTMPQSLVKFARTMEVTPRLGFCEETIFSACQMVVNMAINSTCQDLLQTRKVTRSHTRRLVVLDV